MLTLKQERFAQAVAREEITLADAYRRIYDASHMGDQPIYVEASRLAKHPNVSLRIEQIRREMSVVQEWTLERVVAAALDTHRMAIELRQMGPATQALTLAARILGYDVAHKRNETDITIRVIRDGHNGATQLEAVDAEGVRLLTTGIESDNSDDG
jgi:hypothetical protein